MYLIFVILQYRHILISTVFFFAAPVASIVGHRYTYRAVLMTGGALCSIALFLAAFAPNFNYILSVFAVLTGELIIYYIITFVF